MTIRTQDDVEPRSKQGTVGLFHSDTGVWAELAVDLSQFFQDAVAGVGQMTEAAPGSDRFDRSHPRAIGVLCEADNTDTGRFFQRGAGGTLLEFGINAAGTLRALSDNIAVGTLPIPGIAVGSKNFIFAWVSRANPHTTGAGDAIQSWLMAWNTTDGTFDRTEFHHAAPTLGSSTATWGPYSSTITDFWHEMRAQSATEIANDWGAASPVAPATACELTEPVLPLTVQSGIGDEGQLHGPVPQWAGRMLRHAIDRTRSPLVNVRFSGTPTINNLTAIDHPAYRFLPGSTTDFMNIGWLAPRPVPVGVTHAWVRVHVQSWVTAGAPVPVRISVVSMNRRPDFPEDGPLVVFPISQLFTRDDTAAGPGAWQIEAVVKLSTREENGIDWTLLGVAYVFDPENTSANDANALIKVRAFHAVPCVSSVVGAA
jgi:hypothetical protein